MYVMLVSLYYLCVPHYDITSLYASNEPLCILHHINVCAMCLLVNHGTTYWCQYSFTLKTLVLHIFGHHNSLKTQGFNELLRHAS